MKQENIIEVLAALASTTDLKQYLERKIAAPYFVLDPIFRLIACKEGAQNPNPFFETLQRECYMSVDMLKKLLKAIGKESLPDEFVGEVMLDGSATHLFLHVSKKNQLVISILLVVRQEQNFSEEEITCLRESAAVFCIGQRMLKINDIMRGEYEESFIRNLLHGKYRNQDELQDEFLRTHIRRKKYLYVVSITSAKNLGEKKREGSQRSIRFFLGEIRNLFQNSSTVVVRDQYLVSIISTDKNLYGFEKELQCAGDFLNRENMVLCCSNGVKKLQDIAIAYDQTMKCFQMITERTLQESRIKVYYKFALRHMYQTIAVDQDIEHYCHPAVSILRDYDEQNQTDYAKTLFAYLKNCQCLANTAQELYIHRNTLSKRMEKISELTEIDFENGTELAHITVSYEMIYNGYTAS